VPVWAGMLCNRQGDGMEITRSRQTAMPPAEGIPFAGLGHSLAPVRLRARLLVPVYSGAGCRGVSGVQRPVARQLYGFALQVRLGREIRGR